MKNKFMMAVAAVSLLASGNAMATGTKKLSGPYIGVSGGYGFGQAKVSDSEQQVVNKLGPKGYVTGLHAGWLTELGSLFTAGVDAGFSLSNNKASYVDKDVSLSESVKRTHFYNVAAVVGVKVAEGTQVYAKLGYERGRFKVQSKFDNGVSESVAGKRKTLNAFVPAVGIETMVSSNVKLGLEYAHAFYKTLTASDTNTKVKVKPTLGTTTLRLSYKF